MSASVLATLPNAPAALILAKGLELIIEILRRNILQGLVQRVCIDHIPFLLVADSGDGAVRRSIRQ